MGLEADPKTYVWIIAGICGLLVLFIFGLLRSAKVRASDSRPDCSVNEVIFYLNENIRFDVSKAQYMPPLKDLQKSLAAGQIECWGHLHDGIKKPTTHPISADLWSDAIFEPIIGFNHYSRKPKISSYQVRTSDGNFTNIQFCWHQIQSNWIRNHYKIPE